MRSSAAFPRALTQCTTISPDAEIAHGVPVRLIAKALDEAFRPNTSPPRGHLSIVARTASDTSDDSSRSPSPIAPAAGTSTTRAVSSSSIPGNQIDDESANAAELASANVPTSANQCLDVSAQQIQEATAVKRLAAMSPGDYDRARIDEAAALDIRVTTLDDMVAKQRKSVDGGNGSLFRDIDPWPASINPAALLTEISFTVRRFVICTRETADAVALWVAMTWLMDVVEVAPLAVITAPEKRCGKSVLLSIIGKLSRRPLSTSNISPAAMFRVIEACAPTLLIDETDACLSDKEELRGIINSGHTRDSAYVLRVVGEDYTLKRFSVWGAKALAGIGHLADTIMDRSIVFELRRKLPIEKVEHLRHANDGLFDALAQKLARFADDYRGDVRRARPALPDALNDRAQDNWEPLLAIAGTAGGPWPGIARQAALRLSKSDNAALSTGVELLSDIREIFRTRNVIRISTDELIKALCADHEKQWATCNRGKEINARWLSQKLSGYGIKSGSVRTGAKETPKGYKLESFQEAFASYLPEYPAESATTPQSSIGAALRVADAPMHELHEIPSATPQTLAA